MTTRAPLKPLIQLLLTVGVALGGCTLTACGGAAGAGASSSVSARTATPSPSTDATAAYRHVLEQGNGLIHSDESTFASSCNNGVPPLKGSCGRWAVEDEALVNQFVGLLNNAQVPAAAASNDQRLRQGLRMFLADDTAAASAIGSGDQPAATHALGKIETDNCTVVAPALSRLDSSLTIPSFC